MRNFLMLLFLIFLGILASFYIKTQKNKIVFVRPSIPMWWGPAGRIPPNPPARWGYRPLCRKRLNC